MPFKVFIKKVIPGYVLRALHNMGLIKSYIPVQGKVNMGDLKRTSPFSKVFGFDRGGPIDRYFIQNFLSANADSIHGRVLEIGDNEYTLRYGGVKVTQSDVLHINEQNTKATFIGDLSNAPHLPENAFDCIILTQTLQFIYDHTEALKTCYRTLKPSGNLLLTVPGISQIEQGEWTKYWLWGYTKSSIELLLQEAFIPEKIVVETHGNVMVASSFLYGMGTPEIDKKQLDYNDPLYQVIITAVASK